MSLADILVIQDLVGSLATFVGTASDYYQKYIRNFELLWILLQLAFNFYFLYNLNEKKKQNQRLVPINIQTKQILLALSTAALILSLILTLLKKSKK